MQVRIRLFHSAGFYSRVIQCRTWSEWNHVAFVMEDGGMLGALSQGVCIQYKDDDAIYTQDFVVNVPQFDWVWLNAQIGKPYDWSAIYGMAFNRDWHSENSWFCSELVAAAFEQSGYPLLRIGQENRVTPRDISISPLLSPI